MAEIGSIAPKRRHTAILAGKGATRPPLAAALERSGYEVRQVSDPFHALVALENDPTIDLLVTDTFFGEDRPHGANLARAARLIRETVRIYYVEADAAEPEREAQSLVARLAARTQRGFLRSAA